MEFPDSIYQDVFVKKMDDGGMGSFLIFESAHGSDRERKFGKEVAEFEFVDDDGVLVSVSLNLDDQNKLFEVDVWKVDFSPVIKFKVPCE